MHFMSCRVSWAIASVIALSCSHASAQLITKRVTVQPIQVRSTDGTIAANPSLTLYEAEADKIWAQAGIDIDFLDESWMTYDNSSFLNLSSSIASSTSLYALKATAGQPWSTTGGTLGLNVVRLFFVQLIDGNSSAYGFTLESSLEPDIFGNPNPAQERFASIADSVFSSNRRDTISHELGHALALNHTQFGAGGPNNLMTAGSRNIPGSTADIYPDGGDYDQLAGVLSGTSPNWQTDQIDRVRRMPMAVDLPANQWYTYTPVPEPQSAALLVAGVLMGWGLLRRKSA